MSQTLPQSWAKPEWLFIINWAILKAGKRVVQLPAFPPNLMFLPKDKTRQYRQMPTKTQADM